MNNKKIKFGITILIVTCDLFMFYFGGFYAFIVDIYNGKA